VDAEVFEGGVGRPAHGTRVVGGLVVNEDHVAPHVLSVAEHLATYFARMHIILQKITSSLAHDCILYDNMVNFSLTYYC
jgi:hypothetical protein